MKVVTSSVLTVDLDDVVDRDFLAALEKVAKRDKFTVEKALGGVVSNFFSKGGEPPEGGAIPRARRQPLSLPDSNRVKNKGKTLAKPLERENQSIP